MFPHTMFPHTMSPKAAVVATLVLFSPFALAQSEPDPTPERPWDCAEVPDDLSETTLYSDFEARQIADSARLFEPAYVLWSDFSKKRRWLQLPEGGTIDNADQDYWVFPMGTQVWKEFTTTRNPSAPISDGDISVVVETRLMVKCLEYTSDEAGEEKWEAMSYVWNDDGTNAKRNDGEGANDVRGTGWEVPSWQQCEGCHRNDEADMPIGVSAILLNPQAEVSTLTLRQLSEEELLTHPVAEVDLPLLRLPGTKDEQQAMGYLHVNCGSCHGTKGMMSETAPWMWMETDTLTAQDPRQTSMWKHLVFDGVEHEGYQNGYIEGDGTFRVLIHPGSPMASYVFQRISVRTRSTEHDDPDSDQYIHPDWTADPLGFGSHGITQMPFYGSRLVDMDYDGISREATGQAELQDWIAGIEVDTAVDRMLRSILKAKKKLRRNIDRALGR
ncbi:MAG: hypothetical protein ACI8RZ_002542 [Myxococcota bacterium]|jgi:hypothetical protein